MCTGVHVYVGNSMCFIYYFREEYNDPDYIPIHDNSMNDDNVEEEEEEEEQDPIWKQRTFLVYESCLKQLLRYCMKCGAPIDSSSTQEMQNTGSQLSFHLTCFKGM